MERYTFNTVALTGATGTLGIAIISECIEHKINIIAFIHKNSKNENRIPNSQFIKKIYCSLEELENINIGDLKADVFIHLAWGNTNRLLRNELKPQIENIKYSIDSVILAHKLNCRVYVGAGSQAEYGRKSETINEKTEAKPETAYGIAKLCSAQMTRLECKNRNIKHIWPRIFSTYGPYTQDSTILNYTISKLLKSEVPSLTGCDQIWDFLYVKDAAYALLLLADKGIDGEVYCVASGRAQQMKNYINEISNLLNNPVKIGYGDIPYDDNTVMCLKADISKIKDIGFVAKTEFRDGIIETIDWARKYYTL